MFKLWRKRRVRFSARRTEEQMRTWFDSPIGAYVLNEERQLLEEQLQSSFGYFGLQIGVCPGLSLIELSPVTSKFHLYAQHKSASGEPGALVADPRSLPLASDSIDLLVLHHILDFSLHPHQMIREAARVLIPEGQLVIVGFNPMSLWGLRKLLIQTPNRAPWNANQLGAGRLLDWLHLLQINTESVSFIAHRVPLWPKLYQRLAFMESLGKKFNWPMGGVYMIVAKKQVSALTEIKFKWRNTGLASQPAAASRIYETQAYETRSSQPDKKPQLRPQIRVPAD